MTRSSVSSTRLSTTAQRRLAGEASRRGLEIPGQTRSDEADPAPQDEYAEQRQRLTDFCQYVDPTMAHCYDTRHLRYVAEKLEAVERGEIKRLMLFLPPRHWKSSLASEKFPAWYLGKNPGKTVIAVSHGGDLAEQFSRSVRGLIGENDYYRDLFPNVHLKPNLKSSANWALQGAYRSTYRAAGVTGSITGRGAHLILIDDPVADEQAVATKAQRDKLFAIYQTKLRNRLEPGGAIILIMTRWHEDDLAGRLLRLAKEGQGEKWEVVCLPALAEPKQRYSREKVEPVPEETEATAVSPAIVESIDAIGRKEGEPLWPEHFDLAELDALRIASGNRGWAALYQQRPRPDSGNIMDSSKLIRVDLSEVPKLSRTFRAWDLAFSEKDSADRLAGVKMGIDGQNVYILHIKTLQGRWPLNKPKIMQFAEDDGRGVTVSIEANGTQLGYYQDVHDDPKMHGYKVAKYKPDGSKEMRAEVWGSRLEDKIIHVVRADWNQAFFDEMDDFPNGEHDDQVDGVSQGWAQLHTGGWFRDPETLAKLAGKPLYGEEAE